MKIKRFLCCAGRVLRILVFVCVAAVLVGNLYIAAAKNIFGQSNPTFLGFSDAVVLTGSMSGTIEPNDVILTHKQDEYDVGDIITFYAEGSSVTHRIVAVDEDGYHTKGDANNTAEELPVGREAVVGKVILVIPRLGTLFRFAKTPAGVLSFLGLAAIIIELPGIVKYIKKKCQEA